MDNEMVVFDAYHKWMGIPAAEQPADFYRLLGLARFESDPDVIDAAANKQMAYLRGCAKGDHADLAEEILNEVARARLCLLNEQQKSAYDADLKRRDQAPVPPLRSPVILNAPPASRRAGSNADKADDWGSLDTLPTLLGDALGRMRSVWIWFSIGALTGTLITIALVSNPSDPDRRPVDQSASADSNADELMPQITNSIGMKMILIPAGDFMMGSFSGDVMANYDETPQHKVSISKRFYMGCFEITQGQYQDVMGENPSMLDYADKPVDRVSWLKATEFCRKLSDKETALYRLPTEAEWEYACRAGTTGKNHFSGFPDEHAYYDETSHFFVRLGGQLKPNAFGLFDMNGNVKEWCHDHYDGRFYETSTSSVDPIGPLENSHLRVMRGGSCDDVIEKCNSTYRFAEISYRQSSKHGFRVIKIIDGHPDDYDDWAGTTSDRWEGQSPR